MSDFRREPLISLGTKSANNDKSQPVKRSVRISVTLPESTEDRYPQYNFRQELAAWEEKQISSHREKSQNGLDPFNDDDDDVRRVAQELEAKYGISSKKKRRKRKTNVAIGYDESDSFIDNTDCYDELIPKNITALHEGFYINSGALEFKPTAEASLNKPLSSSEEEEEEEVVPEKSKKRSLASSSDSETDEKQKTENKKKKQKISNGNANGIQKALKNKLFSDDKIKKIRKNSTDDDKKKAVRDLLKEKRDDLNISVPETPKPTGEVEVASSTNIATVIESVVNASNGNVIQVIDDSSRESTGSKENQKTDTTLLLDGDSNDVIPLKQEEIVKLPDNIPNDILTLIDEIKHAAALSTEGKVKFFSGPVSTILLSLERRCRTLKKSTRVRIYEHLAPFVRCRKETLIKRAKNLIMEDDQKKIGQLLNQLHSEVQKVIPSLLQSYEIECQKVLQKRFLKEGLESKDLKSTGMPKRRFTWTEETKKLLREIVTLRKKCFLMEGKNKDKLDELLTGYLKSNVQVLWPEGWMSVNGLLKYSNLEVKKPGMPISNVTNIKNVSISDADVSKESIGNSSFGSNILPPITSKSSSLTITPIMPADVHKNTEDQIAKAKASLPSDIIISNVNSNSFSIKANKPLPMSIEITKTTPEQSVSNKHSSPSQEKDELQLIQQAMAEDLSQKSNSATKTSSSNLSTSQNRNFNDVCSSDRDLIMDLTDSVELKRKPGPKSKTKYYVEDPERPIKIKKATSDKMKSGNSRDGYSSSKESDQYPQVSFSSKDNRSNYGINSHESLTSGSYALEKIISDSLADSKCYPSSDNFSTLQRNSVECTPINVGSASTMTYSVKPRHSQEGDDNQIQEVLEGLRVLQKMSSPAKVDDYGRTSAPASVITYNSKSPTSSSSSSAGGGGGTSSQKSDTTKKHTPNNNYAQPYYNKLFNNISNQQGSYNMLQDMFANLLKESGYKTAGDKSDVQQK